MRSGNPTLKESTFLDLASGSVVSRDGEAMTLNGTVSKTGFLLLLTVRTAAFAWSQVEFGVDGRPQPGFGMYLWGGAIGGFIIAMVTVFKKEWAPVTAPLYALVEGFFLGAISAMYNFMYEGIVLQAVVATFAVFAVSLGLFASGKVRVTGKFTRFLLIGMLGYLAFSLVNVVLMLTGVSTDPWGLRTGVEIFGIPLGLLVGVVAVFLAAMSLIMDFDSIKRGVEAGVPGRYAWAAAFGLAVTLIWLYLELLRLLAILRSE